MEKGEPRVIGYAPRMDATEEAVTVMPMQQVISDTAAPAIAPAVQDVEPEAGTNAPADALRP